MATERYFSVDVLADILRRLPPSSRRRARLVCRHWRDVVNKRTAEMQSYTKPLVWKDGVAYVIDDLSSESTGLCKELWRKKVATTDWMTRSTTNEDGRHSHLVGTCNGLLCICSNEERVGGSITVVNPATGETLHVPPLPYTRPFVGHHSMRTWHAAYSFAYHPTTGKYKVVHVPCSYNPLPDFKAVQVITLGETAWREVSSAPVGGARCNVSAGVISVDGTTHWVKVGGDPRIMSFDLDAERFASGDTPLPRLPGTHSSYHLTEVHGRLGLVMFPDVWVLEQGRRRRRWSRLYRIHGGIPRPHFVFGDCILTRRDRLGFYAHRPYGMVQVKHHDQATLVAKMTGRYDYFHQDCYRTFAHVETTEPLSVYAQN